MVYVEREIKYIINKEEIMRDKRIKADRIKYQTQKRRTLKNKVGELQAKGNRCNQWAERVVT